jgi:RNA recognition motif-containing protein
MNIFVGGIPYNSREEEIREQFERFGTVASCKIIIDRETGRSKGFGFVEMPNEDEAKKAVEALNDFEFGGKTLGVRIAEERKPRDFKDSRGGRDNNRNRGGGGNRW